jgi:hypothetical protein
VAIGFGAPVDAELTAGQKTAAEALIKQFSAAEFDLRQQAVDKLVALGPDVAPLVKKALEETADNEVKLRCEMVLKALGADEAAPPAAKPDKFGFDASKVTIKVKDAALDDILQAFADQSGNARIETPAGREGEHVTLDVSDCPYWQALDRLCADAKLAVTVNPATGAVQLVASGEADRAGVATGPLFVRMESATRVKRYIPSAGPVDRPALLLGLAYLWEDRLRPIDEEADVKRIVGEDGKELPLGDRAAGRFSGGFVVAGVRPGPRAAFSAAVPDVPGDVRSLKSVEGIVRITFGAGRRELRVNDVFGAGAAPGAVVGNQKLFILRSQKGGGSASVSLRHSIDGKEAKASRYPALSGWGLALVDPKGVRHLPAENNMENNMVVWDGGKEIVVRQQPGGGILVMERDAAADGGNVTADFENVPDVDGAWTLIYTVPDTIAEREYGFKLTDVKLP